jgi:hypothetical protein
MQAGYGEVFNALNAQKSLLNQILLKAIEITSSCVPEIEDEIKINDRLWVDYNHMCCWPSEQKMKKMLTDTLARSTRIIEWRQKLY